jgi:uncharacterized Zn finger protein (UPF0148 family)
MGKARTFNAKLAHESTMEGKVVCPVCNTEVKAIKLIRSRKAANGNWAPKYEFRKICKCNEKDIMSGKI